MKKLLFLFLLLISFSVGAQTTQQEYDYVTKELKDDLIKGIGVKKGYILEEYLRIANPETDWFVSHYLLKKEDVKMPIAIVIVSGRSLSDVASFFYCIPAYNSDKAIWEQFEKSVATFEDGFTYQNAVALSKALTIK